MCEIQFTKFSSPDLGKKKRRTTERKKKEEKELQFNNTHWCQFERTGKNRKNKRQIVG